MTKFSTMTGLIALAAVGAVPVLAQTVPDSEVSTTSLNIPGNVQLYGDAKPNVYRPRSEEHTSELQSLMRISYAVFCLKKKTTTIITQTLNTQHHTSTRKT